MRTILAILLLASNLSAAVLSLQNPAYVASILKPAASGCTAPNAPTAMSLNLVSDTPNITVEWTDPASASGIEVWRGTNGGSMNYLSNAPLASGVYIDYSATVTNGVVYEYKVRATNNCSASAQSAFTASRTNDVYYGEEHHWTLNEAAMATRVDDPGSSDFDTVNTVASVSGINNNCARFNVVASVGTGPLQASVSMTAPASYSVVTWQRIDSSAVADAFLAVTLDADGDGVIKSLLASSGEASFSFSEENSITTMGVSLDTWHCMVATFDGGSGDGVIYIDGASAGTSNGSGGAWGVPAMGGFGTGSGIVGYIDDTRILPRVLSAAEVTNIWASGAGRFGQ